MKGTADVWVFAGLLALATAAPAQDAPEVDHAVEQLMDRLIASVEKAPVKARSVESRMEAELRRQEMEAELRRREMEAELRRREMEAERHTEATVHTPHPSLPLQGGIAADLAVEQQPVSKSLKQREATEMGRLIERLTASGESAGTVIRVGETGVLFIQLDRQGGLTEGSQVELMRAKAPTRVGDERVGFDEESLGTAKITRLIKDKALAHMTVDARGIVKPGDKIYAANQRKERLVVASFTYNNHLTEFSISLQEKLITALVHQGVKVVERSQLEKVLMEQQLSYSGLVDLNSAQQIGKLLSAAAMILGTITDEGNEVAVNARLVEVGTADIVTAAEVELAKTPVVVKGLETIITASWVAGGVSK
jgi:TolB-like protein